MLYKQKSIKFATKLLLYHFIMNLNFRKNLYFLAIISIVSFSSCGGGDDDLDEVIGSGNGGTNNVPSIAVNPYTTRTEVPELKKGNKFIQHSSKVGNDSVMTYCLEYDPSVFHSRWVAFRFDSQTAVQASGVKRQDNFIDDPQLPNSEKIGYNGFGKQYVDNNGVSRTWSGTSSQFDRGHICASHDRLYSQAANNQTFYMSNMSPQLGEFNQGFWNAFELFVQNLARPKLIADTLFVVKGGTIDKDKVLGYVKRSNGAQVVIPKYYYMALLACKDGKYNAIGFWMEHKEYGYDNGPKVPKDIIASYAVSIDDLEQKTGINFFHNLPDAIENDVEKVYNAPYWGL